jgi:hypothetical protein
MNKESLMLHSMLQLNHFDRLIIKSINLKFNDLSSYTMNISLYHCILKVRNHFGTRESDFAGQRK